MKPSFYAVLALLATTLACTPAEAQPTAWVLPNGEGECVARSSSHVTIYSRPHTEADVFVEVQDGLMQPLTARTVRGWLGFDPGVAQAANLGPFRLRWLWHADVSLSGNCAALPEVWAPLDNYCYNMPMDAVLVYEQPSASARVITTLQQGQFAAVMGLTEDGWAEADLELGNTGLSGTGWVDAQTLNLNGSACSQLPRLDP
ncbi:MAG: hypothetical protein KJZ53_01965 [Anaerolineales bacterium]|nr:hypothetical protein [Anaerolineales bacterium]